MKKDNDSHEPTSRRQFTKAIVTAVVAAPVMASVACKTDNPSVNTSQPKADPCPVEVDSKDEFTTFTWKGPVTTEDHIPPMGIDGGGSLIVDSKNKLATSGGGPFDYLETDLPPAPNTNKARYGEIQGATIITESESKPFLKITNYSALLPGAELWLWFQDLKDSNPADPDEIEFKPPPPPPYPPNDPDVKIKGGRGANLFKLTLKKKKFDPKANSHKKNRPHRYKYSPAGGGGPKDFRIGRWQLVNGATVLAFAEGDDTYKIYLDFAHYQPPI